MTCSTSRTDLHRPYAMRIIPSARLICYRISISMPTAVSYIRVSTSKQAQSGLGLEAQEAAIAAFCTQHGIDIAGSYSEIETGKGHDALDRRPQLAAALAHARKLKAPVVVAKLDRLGRDVHF